MVVLLGKERTSLLIITLHIFLAIFEKWHCAANTVQSVRELEPQNVNIQKKVLER